MLLHLRYLDTDAYNVVFADDETMEGVSLAASAKILYDHVQTMVAGWHLATPLNENEFNEVIDKWANKNLFYKNNENTWTPKFEIY